MKGIFYAPLYEALSRHAASRPLSLHVPGHHNSNTFTTELVNMHVGLIDIAARYKPIMEIDLTELSSTDDLHHPEASIQEAQHLAAQCFGADNTYFLVGGSTSGNIALLLTVCKPGDTVIVQRNVHKSIINGLKLAGATAVFVMPQIDQETGLATIPSVEQVKEALRRHPEACAVFLTNPNYYGISVRIEAYAEAVHCRSIPLLIDEAHGAHYGFHPELPMSALSAGADAVVQSTHKTLPALTMGAMLHIRGMRIDQDRLRQSLAMIQSSSPSFPIMASLDISRAMIQLAGEKLFNNCLDHSRKLKEWLQLGDLIIQAVHNNNETKDGLLRHDPLRVILYDRNGQLTGYELQRELEEQGCWSEMADLRYVVLVIGIHFGSKELERLKTAIIHIHEKYKCMGLVPKYTMISPAPFVTEDQHADISTPVSFARDNELMKESISVPLGEAVGMCAAELIIPYPPGIPLVYPGERLTPETLGLMERLVNAGAKFQGSKHPSLATIEVFCE